MTNTIISIAILTTIMMTAAISASIEIIPEAEATKSAGANAPGRVGADSYGSKNKFIVCGDRLCSEYPGGYEQFIKDQGTGAKIGTEAVPPQIAEEETVEEKPMEEKPMEEKPMEEKPMMEEEQAPGSVLKLSRASVPATIPLHEGYYNGESVHFIITDSSDEFHADEITKAQGWKVELAPLLANAPNAALTTTYLFLNGQEGNGVHGYQLEVFSSTPAQPDLYSGLSSVTHVTWSDESSATELESEDEILAAEADGLVTLESIKVVLNTPQIVWPGGQMMVKEDKTLTDETPYGGGQVLDIDTDANTVTFIAHRGWGPDGRTIYYIVTDATPSGPAGGMGVTYAPTSASLIANSAAVDLFQFSNGLTGSGPKGFQAGIAASAPGDKNYSPMWRISFIAWQNPAEAGLIETIGDINYYKEAGLIDVNLARPMDSDHIVNCPFIDPFQ